MKRPLFAIFAVGLLCLTAFVGLAGTASVLSAAGAPAPSHAASARAPTDTALWAELGSYDPAIATMLKAVPYEEQIVLQKRLVSEVVRPDTIDLGAVAIAGGLTVVGVCAVAAVESAGTACLAALVVYGIVLLAVYLFDVFTGNSNPVNPLYAPAVAQMEQILGAAQNAFNTGTQSINYSVSNMESTTNLTVGVAEYQAANAAISQIGNATFNAGLDIQNSGNYLTAAENTYLAEYEMASALVTAGNTTELFYGPSGGYGAHGIFCALRLSGTANGGINGSYGVTFSGGGNFVQNESGDSFGGDGKCLEGASGINVVNGQFYGGTIINTRGVGIEYAVLPNASLWATSYSDSPNNAVSIQFEPVANHSKTINVTVPIGPAGTSLPNPNSPIPSRLHRGVWIYKGAWECNTLVSSSCAHPSGTQIATSELIEGVGFAPVNVNYSTDAEVFDTAQPSVFATHTGSDAFGGLLDACGIGGGFAGSGNGGEIKNQEEFSDEMVKTCPASVTTLGKNLNQLVNDATTVAKAYWEFLRGNGWTSPSQIPPSCVLPSVEDFLPPNLNLSQLASLGTGTILAMLLAYVHQQEANWGNVTGGSYCGTHPKQVGNITIGNLKTVVDADIYLPPSSYSPSQFASPALWPYVNQQIFIAPSVGNLTIPINETWEAPSNNPSLLFWGNLTGPHNSTVPYVLKPKTAENATFFPRGFDNHFEGNSSLINGSAYPHNVTPADGHGDALFITGCYANTTVGSVTKWRALTECNVTIQVLHYNYSKNSCILFGTNCHPPQFPLATSCGNGAVDEIAGPFENIPFVGKFACLIGWAIVIVILGVISIAFIYAGVRVLGRKRDT